MSTGITIERIEGRALSLALSTPFSIATGAQMQANNVLVSVTLSDGTVGLGEAAPFPAVNGETQAQALAAVAELSAALAGQPLRLRLLSTMSTCKSAQCAVEVALLDAFCRSHRMSMWHYFGAADPQLVTDYTITTGTPPQAEDAAAKIAAKGFSTIKLKVGGAALSVDEARIEAVLKGAKAARLIIDGNCAFSTVEQITRLCDVARSLGGNVVLIEQPFAVDNEDAQRALTQASAIPVAADESVASLHDVLRIAERKLAHVVNLKPTKSGFFAAREMAIVARACGLELMVGAMVESELALSATACLVAGLGGVRFCDLDTHMFFANSPMRGGFVQRGEVLDVSAITAGHGVEVG